MTSKLALGTVQFGLDYGINNKSGQVRETEVYKILHEAKRAGINVLDTAYAYGCSEGVIGKFMQSEQVVFDIISKLPECDAGHVRMYFQSTLSRLGRENIYAYMCHSFQNFKENTQIWAELQALKSAGELEKIGFSLYYPDELDYILENNLNPDIIQVPYNVFDQRFAQYFPKLKERGIEVLVRSVFLQGLVFKEVNELDPFFFNLKNKMDALNLLSDKTGISILALCLNFAVLNESIDKVILGVDSLQNLKEIVLAYACCDDVKEIMDSLLTLREDDENMILPTKWKVKR